MSNSNYLAPEELKVNIYFKRNPLIDWSFPQYFEWRKRLSPFDVNFKKIQKEYNDDLETIKKSDLVDRETAKDKQAYKVINNITYKDHASHVEISSSAVTLSMSSANEAQLEINGNAKNKNQKSTEAPDNNQANDSSETSLDFDMNTLYHCLYKLYKNEQVDLSRLSIQPAVTIRQKIYNECVSLLKNFKQLQPVAKSRLDVLLSSCLNTISVDFREDMKRIIDLNQLETILNSKPIPSFSNYSTRQWDQLKETLRETYKAGGKKSLRKFVARECSKIYEDDLETAKAFELMILDTYNIILDSISYKNWHEEDLHEEDSGSYWKAVLDVLFRGTGISLVRGEACCQATKYERQINEYEYGSTSNNIFGRKLDLIIKSDIFDDKNIKRKIELSSVEIKPINVSENAEAIQLNKNIRVNKSILHNIFLHTGDKAKGHHVLGLDVIGLSAFAYVLFQFQDIVVAVKADEENMLLPADDDDLEEFVMGNTLEQLLNFKSSILETVDKINKASRRYKRLRLSSKTSCATTPRLQSPPRRPFSFPKDTFYTPKRN
ncbi:hypothetical protein BD560DRAFT_449341 [Blakeslea trispora]|nr:hypothetical protein BD560DRAFT_449341 [Blakeslea trispora]